MFNDNLTEVDQRLVFCACSTSTECELQERAQAVGLLLFPCSFCVSWFVPITSSVCQVLPCVCLRLAFQILLCCDCQTDSHGSHEKKTF